MQRALDFLQKNNEVAFATCDRNRPRIRVFQIMKQEGTTLYFATSPQKDVYQELRTNQNVEILAMANKISVRCIGNVQFTVEDAVQKWIYDNTPVLQRLYTAYAKLAYFALPVQIIDYYDLNPTPPLFLHFDLLAGTEGKGFVGERFAKNGNQ